LKTVTDSLGRFSVYVDSPAIRLNFSKLGYNPVSQEFNGEEENIRIFMKVSLVSLEEVEINTGYQRIPRERATGSFVHVGRQQLEAIPGRSIIARLDGIMPGLQFDNRTVGATSS